MSEKEPDKDNGRFGGIQSAAKNADASVITEERKGQIGETMWKVATIEGMRWNKLYPYQLIVIEKTDSGWKDTEWKFTLPIPPQSIDIDMPFAITTSATLGGVIEEHNAAPFRVISMTGTTGVLPLKGSANTVERFNPAQTIFAGTVNALNVAETDVKMRVNAVEGDNIIDDAIFDDESSAINRTSGYYQYHLLKTFLEGYAEIKKKETGRNLRLALAMWKDNSVFLVTPMTFRVNRGADGPFEYRYSLQFKAWSRINLNDNKPSFAAYRPHGRQPSQIATVLNNVRAIRGLLQDSRKVLQAARGDINKALFTPMREMTLMLKEIAGTAKSLADFPINIIKDCKESLLTENINQFKSTVEAFNGINGDAYTNFSFNTTSNTTEKTSKLRDLWLETGKPNTKAGRSDNYSSAAKGPNPANKFFDNIEDNLDLFGLFDPAALKLPPKVQGDIQLETKRVLSYTRKDLELMRDSFVSVLEDFEESVGMSDTTYNNTYNIKPKTTAVPKVATEDDLELMFNLNSLIVEANKLCVSNDMDPNKTDSLEYIAGLARRSGIAFTEPKSKFLAPFPYQHTLEQVAQLYLGDSERWYEIAALNGLRQPYVDEVGFDLYLMTNGTENQIQIADVSNLYTGQIVWISSSTVKPEKRRITGIRNVTDGVNVVSLSGDADLEKFVLSSEPKIHAYLPDTVNSQMSIYIPSQDSVDEEDFRVKPIQGVDYFDNLIRVGGISLLLTPNNDIAFLPDGRSQLAVGLTNIVQRARIALSTYKGALMTHPSYGLPIKPGESTADVDAKEVLKAIRDMFSKDPTFSAITAAYVQKTGPTTRISVNIGIAGSSKIIPITTDIRR